MILDRPHRHTQRNHVSAYISKIIMVWGYVALFGPGPIHCEDGDVPWCYHLNHIYTTTTVILTTIAVNPKTLEDKSCLIIIFLVHHTLGSSAQQQQQQDSSQKIKKQKAGVLEGFRLLLTYDYIKGIFALSCLFMIEVTILDYAMKVGWIVILYVLWLSHTCSGSYMCCCCQCTPSAGDQSPSLLLLHSLSACKPTIWYLKAY